MIAVVFLGLLVGETVTSDRQQWNFHKAKKAGGPEFRPRFLQSGLWKFSRRELLLRAGEWWALFFFGAVAAGSLLQWTVCRRGAAHDPVHRVDDLHREHHEEQVPRVRRLPGHDLDRALAAASRVEGLCSGVA